MITLGKRDSLHTRRQAAAYLLTPGATQKLFSELAPRFADRQGGYTRIVRVGWRIGDGAELAILEFIGSELKKKEKKAKRRPGRRGAKAIPGELSEAEADGEAVARSDGEAGPETEGAPVSDETLKPKKKKSPRKNKTQKAPDGEATAVAQGAETEGTETKRVVRRKPKTPRPTRAPGEDPIGEPSKTMLFVANLGFNVDDDGLAAVFTDAGIHVTSARIVRRRWGQPRKSKGYGFVDVGSEDEQKRAMDVLQDMDVGGRVIAVRIAVDTQRDGDAGEGPANEGPSATA